MSRMLTALIFILVVTPVALAVADPGQTLASEWWLQNTAVWNGPRGQAFTSQGVEATAVWPRSQGQGVVIADIDSGVDASHPDLQGALLPEMDFVKRHGDRLGHGTYVAGILAARGLAGGPFGVAPQALVLPLNIDPGGTTHIDQQALIEAIYYAAKLPEVKIINLSLGGPKNPRLATAVRFALHRGKVIVASAGNLGGNNATESPVYPCDYYAVLCVAATDRSNQLAWFSDFSFDNVMLAAPGDQINSTWLGGRYAIESGTSIAAPIVAGVAALLWGADPQASANEIIRSIVQGVTPNPLLTGIVRTGGVVDAPRSLAILDQLIASDCNAQATTGSPGCTR